MTIEHHPDRAKRPFTFLCDKVDCYHRVTHHTEAAARHEEQTHICLPLKVNYLSDLTDENGTRYTMPSHGKSTVEKLWDELDTSLDKLKSYDFAAKAEVEYEVTILQGKCRGLAFALQLMLAHYYPDIKSVTRQAVKRQKMRSGELGFEPTPGYNYNPPPAGSKAYQELNKQAASQSPNESSAKKRTSTTQSRRRTQATSKPQPEFTDEQKASIRTARDSGMLTNAQLAANFKVTEAYIENL